MKIKTERTRSFVEVFSMVVEAGGKQYFIAEKQDGLHIIEVSNTNNLTIKPSSGNSIVLV